MNISIDMDTGLVTVNRCGNITKLDPAQAKDLELFKLAVKQMTTLAAFHRAMVRSELEREIAYA
jgi:hypothetical protein